MRSFNLYVRTRYQHVPTTRGQVEESTWPADWLGLTDVNDDAMTSVRQ